MASTYKVLGQSNPAATTLTTLYTVPASTSAICSSLVVCNQGTSGTFRIAVRIAGAGISAPQYLYYGTTLGANSTMTATLGITLATTDVVSVYASSTDFSFNLFGSELT